MTKMAATPIYGGLEAKSEILSFVAPPGKRNLVATMAQTHVLGLEKPCCTKLPVAGFL